MKIEVWLPGPPACTMLRPGTLARMSGTVRRCSRSMSCAVMTVTELAICASGVGTLVGLMTMVGSTFCGDADCWAAAAVDNPAASSAASDTDCSDGRRLRVGYKLDVTHHERPRVTACGTSPRTKSLAAANAADQAPIDTPRPICSRVTTADGRSPGSRIAICRRLPGPRTQWHLTTDSPLTVAGAAAV